MFSLFLFNSFEEFAEGTPNWDLDFKQISTGTLHASLNIHLYDDVFLYECSFDKKVDQTGMAPMGMRTFCMLSPTSAPTYWCKHQIDSFFLLEFASNQEFSAVSQSGFEVAVISMSDTKLQKIAQKTVYREIPLASSFSAHHTTYSEQTIICNLIKKLMYVENSWIRDSIEESVIFQVISICLRGQQDRFFGRSSFRQKGLEQAIKFIKNNLDEPITMEDILQKAQVSPRTLEYAFQQHFGLSPKKYVKYLRLNQVHRHLMNNSSKETVTDIANQTGFSHMSQFAKDYRALFGKNPSEEGSRNTVLCRK